MVGDNQIQTELVGFAAGLETGGTGIDADAERGAIGMSLANRFHADAMTVIAPVRDRRRHMGAGGLQGLDQDRRTGYAVAIEIAENVDMFRIRNGRRQTTGRLRHIPHAVGIRQIGQARGEIAIAFAQVAIGQQPLPGCEWIVGIQWLVPPCQAPATDGQLIG